jgi:hypothetical protein
MTIPLIFCCILTQPSPRGVSGAASADGHEALSRRAGLELPAVSALARAGGTAGIVLASIVQASRGPVTDCVGIRFLASCPFRSGAGGAHVARGAGCAPAPTAPGWSSFGVAGVIRAVQAGAGRAQSRCQQVRNASAQGQSGLMARVFWRAWAASFAGRCQIR